MYSEWDRAETLGNVGGFEPGPESIHSDRLLPREHGMPQSARIGESSMRFEPPDICVVSYVGDLNGDDVAKMNAAVGRVAKRVGSIYLMVNLRDTGDVSEEARAGGLRGMCSLNPRATAVFGADFHLRVVATLIAKAARLIDARVKGPVSFFDRERDARAWIEEIRRRAGSRRM